MTFGKCYLVFIALREDCIFGMDISLCFFFKSILLGIGYAKC